MWYARTERLVGEAGGIAKNPRDTAVVTKVNIRSCLRSSESLKESRAHHPIATNPVGHAWFTLLIIVEDGYSSCTVCICVFTKTDYVRMGTQTIPCTIAQPRRRAMAFINSPRHTEASP